MTFVQYIIHAHSKNHILHYNNPIKNHRIGCNKPHTHIIEKPTLLQYNIPSVCIYVTVFGYKSSEWITTRLSDHDTK